MASTEQQADEIERKFKIALVKEIQFEIKKINDTKSNYMGVPCKGKSVFCTLSFGGKVLEESFLFIFLNIDGKLRLVNIQIIP